MSIYLASSWRNPLQPALVHLLRDTGFEVYDFRHPPKATGFHWSEVGLPNTTGHNDSCPVGNYLAALQHPRSVDAFDSDFDAMKNADTFVLALPCGRSAHLELGWAVGAGKRTAILLDDPCTPELMYRMVDHLAPDVGSLLDWLGHPET